MTFWLAVLLSATPEPVTVVPEDAIQLPPGLIELEWDCERDGGRDKLRISEAMGPDGKYPMFTRTIADQPPKVVVDCGAEVIIDRTFSLSMFSGFCTPEWGLEIRLGHLGADRAVADLRLGQEWLKGYQCRRRKG